jgi:hypothetical protein
MSKIDDTLAARDTRYGTFYNNASVAQNLKFMMRSSPNWGKLAPDQKEALDHISSKIGRILTGDFNYIDSWHDITGYAKLVENRLSPKDADTPTGWAMPADSVKAGDVLYGPGFRSLSEPRWALSVWDGVGRHGYCGNCGCRWGAHRVDLASQNCPAAEFPLNRG